jgi:ATP-dependent exoDNAse (exonuclease V) alpha subunit
MRVLRNDCLSRSLLATYRWWLSGIAAENLESGSGIASRTIASMEHGWGQGRELLTARDVLVIDEAGMVGTRQMERVLSHAAEAGAKVVLVGDPQQLQSIEAGAAFRSIHERHGGAEIGEVGRQREDWQRDATRDLATGRTGDGIHAYDSHGMVHAAPTRDQARDDLIGRWDRERQASPDQSRIILTHTNDEVRALNDAARDRMRAAGDLGDDVRLVVERGERSFASGDRVMFLQNERGLGVKNGTLGSIEQVTFPAQVRISVIGAGWRESDIDRWIADPAGRRPPMNRQSVGTTRLKPWTT